MTSANGFVDRNLSEALQILTRLSQSENSNSDALADLERLRLLIGSVRLSLRLPMPNDTRQEIRLAQLAVSKIQNSESGILADCAIADVSAGGALLIVGDDLAIDPRFTLELPWIGRAVACELRSRKDGLIHAKFADLTSQEAMMIEKAIEYAISKQ